MDETSYHYFLIFLAMLMLSSFTQAEGKMASFEENLLRGSSNDHLLKKLGPRSSVQCARTCAGLSECKSFSVLPTLQECSLYSSKISALGILPASGSEREETFYSSERTGPCPSDKGYDVVPQTAKCVRLYLENRTWTEAEARCEADGGHLAIIENLATWSAMRSFLKGKTERREIYVGGLKTELDQWVWLDGSLVKEELWAPGEPNDRFGTETCLDLLWLRRGQYDQILNDIQCFLKYPFLCEM